MTTIQDIIKDTLTAHIDQHGRLVALNSVGYKLTLYGYIRKVEPDHIVWEDNEFPNPKYKIRNVVSFDPIKLKNV
jgi:hypothetical protein